MIVSFVLMYTLHMVRQLVRVYIHVCLYIVSINILRNRVDTQLTQDERINRKIISFELMYTLHVHVYNYFLSILHCTHPEIQVDRKDITCTG